MQTKKKNFFFRSSAKRELFFVLSFVGGGCDRGSRFGGKKNKMSWMKKDAPDTHTHRSPTAGAKYSSDTIFSTKVAVVAPRRHIDLDRVSIALSDLVS
jgi:hypothetical protein